MNRLRFEVDKDLVVQLRRADSDVAIGGWDQDSVEVVLDGDPDQCTVQEEELALVIQSSVALSINVPRWIHVKVEQVSGDLVLRDLDGPVSVDTVHGESLVQSGGGPLSIQAAFGDLMVEKLGGGPLSVGEAHGDVRLNRLDAPASLGSVHGDVRARTVQADLKIGSVGGDLRVRDVAGLFVLEEGMGDFRGEDLWGGMDVRQVKGDLSLKTALSPGMTYNGRAGGDIVARFPVETSARFTLEAEGTLSARLPQVEEQERGRMVGQAGDGQAQVVLRAHGDLSLKIRGQGGLGEPGFEFGFDEDIAAQIEAQITERLGGVDIDALARHEIEKAMRKAEKEIEKARLRAERHTQRVEERMRRAQERAAGAARRAHERIVRRSHRWRAPSEVSYTFRAGRGARPSGPSEKEQLAILRMVQEGKITVEEAEQLLKALEG